MSKVLIVGGTGFIGGQLVSLLAERGSGFVPVVLTRNPRSNGSIEQRYGDLLKPVTLASAFQDIEYVVQCAQFPGHPVERPWLGASHTYEGLDGQGTVNLIEAIKSGGFRTQIKQIIYLSGAGANLDADYPWLRAKRRAELAIKNCGCYYTILRPSWVYGKGDRSMSRFVLFAKYLPFFPVIGDGSAPVNPVWVKDLAQIIRNVLNDSTAFNTEIPVGTPTMTMLQVAHTVLAAVGNSWKPVIPHPKLLMKAVGMLAQFVPGSPLSPNSVEFLTMDAALNDVPPIIRGVKLHQLKQGLIAAGMLGDV